MTASTAGVRVVLAAEHRLLLEATRALLEPAADFEVVGTTHEGNRVAALVDEVAPDLLLLDSRLCTVDGLSLLHRLRAAHPEVSVVVLADSADGERDGGEPRGGASGVILKSADPEELVPALRAVVRGESPAPEPPPVPRAGEALGLTLREEAVLAGLARGLSNPQIAQELSIAHATVTFHLRNAYAKLGVASRLEALRLIVEQALFGSPYDWLG